MISREEYEKSVFLIKEYHDQLKLNIESLSIPDVIEESLLTDASFYSITALKDHENDKVNLNLASKYYSAAEWFIKNYKPNKSLVYIASPYSHESESMRNYRAELVTFFAASLIEKGDVVFSPISYGHELSKKSDLPTDFKFWDNFCITFLSKCDKMIVLKLDGWEHSIGIKAEINYCRIHNIPIEYV